jgi:hypothetical protein
MGMFDYFRSSYDLGEQFTDVELQTKDIEDGLGGSMSHYWLDPAGYLYHIDYTHTADFVEIKKDNPNYNHTHKWLNFKWVPNGNHGKIRPWMITKYVEVYPSTWDGSWESWPRLRIHFRYGRLMDYTKEKRDYQGPLYAPHPDLNK